MKYIVLNKNKKVRTGEDMAVYDGENMLGDDIGFIMYLPGEETELRQIFVREGDRRKGYGVKMVRALFRAIKEGKIRVNSSTLEEEVFGKFLLSLGFKKVDSNNWEKNL